MKRILFISISSPPKSGPESLQTGKYLEGLSKFFSIDLITTRANDYGWNKKIGNTKDLLLPHVESLIELNSYSNRFFSKLKSLLPKQLKFPDENFHFHKSSNYVIKNLYFVPDIIYSRSSPLSSAILAYKIKEKINRPWVMHLSDPWVDNPFLTNGIKKSKAWEKACMSKADLITVTNKNYLFFLKEKYPTYQHKIELSHNVYEPIEIDPVELDKPFTLIYFGNFYGQRDPEALLIALSQVYLESPNDFKNVNVSFYGNIDSRIQQLFDKYNLPFVNHKGFIHPKKIPDIVKNATILVNMEDQFAELSDILFLPSKIMDYISYQRLILSISSNISPSKDIIKNNYGYVFEHDNLTGIASFIKDAIKAYSKKDIRFFQVNLPDQKFSIGYQTEKLTALFNKLI